MSVFRVQKETNYTVISNNLLRNKNLSLKAIGLMSKVLSLPENWEYSISGLVSICKENKSAIESTLKELQEHGYLVVNKLMPGTMNTKTNTLRSKIEYEYVFYEQPVEVQDIENQVVENQAQLNKDTLNKDVLNKEYEKELDKPILLSESRTTYSANKPRRNYTAKPIIQIEEEPKVKLTKQQRKQLKIKELLDVIPQKLYSQELIDALGEYLDMRIDLHIGKIDRVWFEKEWDENIYPAIQKYSEEDIVRCLRTVVIPKCYKRCFININTYQPRQSNFNDTKPYTATEIEHARAQGVLAIEQAKKDGTYRSEF